MAKFATAYDVTRKIEGGYANHPDDKGGETWKGIARNRWPNWEGWKIVDVMKGKELFPSNLYSAPGLQTKVESFFRSNFWNINKLDLITNQLIANELFDTGVNMGTKTAAIMLQEALNLLNQRGTSYPDLKVDGIIGNKTIQTVNNHSSPSKLLKTLNILQGAKYISIIKNDPTQETWFNGWLERIS